MKLIPEDKDTALLQEIAEEVCGVKLTEEQCLAIFTLNPQYAAEYVTGEVYDTNVKEYLADILAEIITGMSRWPCGGDGEEYTQRFYERMVVNAPAKGFTLDEEYWSNWRSDNITLAGT